jgi:hypothetical protein
MMNGREKSVPVVVAVKSMNEAGQPGEEWMEPRAWRLGLPNPRLNTVTGCVLQKHGRRLIKSVL